MQKKEQSKKRGGYGKHSDDVMKEALEAIHNGMSLRKASDKINIPKSTLSDKKVRKTKIGAKSDRKPYLKPEIENELVQKVTKASSMGFGTSWRQFVIKVGTMCQRTGVARFKHWTPGKDWCYVFMKRHPELSLRQPEKLGNVRARMLNPVVVGKYFEGLKEIVDTLQLNDHPERIWNADECGKQFEHTPMKVLAQRGVRCVIGRTSDDRTDTTIMACAIANGTVMPPTLIVKGKTSKSAH